MKRIYLLLGVIAMSLTSVGAQTAESAFDKLGLYVIVADVERSVAFYTKLFEKAPHLKTETVAFFDVAGGHFVVFAEGASDLTRTRGNSAVPYIRVRNLAREFERAKVLSPNVLDAAIVREGPIALFRCLDPDGNLLEFFSLQTEP